VRGVSTSLDTSGKGVSAFVGRANTPFVPSEVEGCVSVVVGAGRPSFVLSLSKGRRQAERLWLAPFDAACGVAQDVLGANGVSPFADS
jgi:hypothetical protein